MGRSLAGESLEQEYMRGFKMCDGDSAVEASNNSIDGHSEWRVVMSCEEEPAGRMCLWEVKW